MNFILFGPWATPDDAQGYFWLYNQKLFLVELKEPYGMPEIGRSIACKAKSFPAMLSLLPQNESYVKYAQEANRKVFNLEPFTKTALT